MANAYHTKEKYRQIANKLRGQKRTKETCQRISQSLIGHKHSPETLAKLRGKKRSPEFRKFMSNWAKGRTPWKGKHHSKETKQKISLALLGKSPNEETRMKQRESMIKHFKSLNPNYVSPQYSKNPNRIGKWARKERMLRNGGIHSKAQWESLKAAYDYKCPMCDRREPVISLTRDHIISLKNGGSNDISNIQPLCLSCNSKKG